MKAEEFVIKKGKEHFNRKKQYVFPSISSLRTFLEDYDKSQFGVKIKPDSEIRINPELPIGTEFWIMKKNRPVLGLVAGYDVHVTAGTDEKRSWKEQLFERWLRGDQSHKKVWKYSFYYEAKLDDSIAAYTLRRRYDGWYIDDKYKIYFSEEDLRSSIFD